MKSVDEEASLGISQASVVSDLEQLRERVEFVHRSIGTDAIAEEYVEGRELTQSILGNQRLQAFPPWELFFDNLPEGSLPIATARAKFDRKYQARVGIDSGAARELPPATAARIARAVQARLPRARTLGLRAPRPAPRARRAGAT